MMNTDICYCVFWYPTIIHGKQKKQYLGIQQLGPYDLSDNSEDPLMLTITRENAENPKDNANMADAYDLIFELTRKDGQSFKSRFACVGQSNNGFVIYSYDREQIINDYCSIIAGFEFSKSIVDEIIDTLFISFYYYAKQFYHEYNSDSENDGRYTAYFYTQESDEGPRNYLRECPSLSTKNNPVINWYLDQFERQIISNAEEISQKLRDWEPLLELFLMIRPNVKEALSGNDDRKIEKAVKSVQVLSGDYPSGFPQNLSIQEKKVFLNNLYRTNISVITQSCYDMWEVLSSLCNKALIEYTYCKTLLESKYYDNDKRDSVITAEGFVQQPVTSTGTKYGSRINAFNISNSIRYIESAKRKCDILQKRISAITIDDILVLSTDNRVLLQESKKSNRISTRLGWLSFILGIMSIIMGLFSVYLTLK